MVGNWKSDEWNGLNGKFKNLCFPTTKVRYLKSNSQDEFTDKYFNYTKLVVELQFVHWIFVSFTTMLTIIICD